MRGTVSVIFVTKFLSSIIRFLRSHSSTDKVYSRISVAEFLQKAVENYCTVPGLLYYYNMPRFGGRQKLNPAVPDTSFNQTPSTLLMQVTQLLGLLKTDVPRISGVTGSQLLVRRLDEVLKLLPEFEKLNTEGGLNAKVLENMIGLNRVLLSCKIVFRQAMSTTFFQDKKFRDAIRCIIDDLHLWYTKLSTCLSTASVQRDLQAVMSEHEKIRKKLCKINEKKVSFDKKNHYADEDDHDEDESATHSTHTHKTTVTTTMADLPVSGHAQYLEGKHQTNQTKK